MFPHCLPTDPWYAEQVLLFEAGPPRPHAASEAAIPLRGVMLWCVALWTIAVAIGGTIKWIA